MKRHYNRDGHPLCGVKLGAKDELGGIINCVACLDALREEKKP